jgi:GAF domain-containing protein
VDSKRPYSFSDKEHKILQLFAQIVAHRETRPANEEFVGDIPRYFAELGIIQDLRNRCTNWTNFLPKFLKSMTDATGFDYGAFASLDYEGETYTVEAETERMFIDVGMALSLGSGIAGWVFRNGQDVMENDASATPLFNRQEGAPEFQSVVCLPLIIRKTTRGVFCLAHKERKAVDETMRSFLKQAVDHLALFLENMVLREWLRYALPKAEIHKEGQSAYDAGGRTGER